MIDANDSYKVADKQRELLAMMCDLHSFCVKNDIKYSIIGGTLLGAIRDKGFIPWDDDIDIILDRANFEKLLSKRRELGKYCIKEQLWVFKIVRKDTFRKEGIKDSTPVLDIFIADRVPASSLGHRVKVLCLKTLQGMMKERANQKKQFSLFYKAALAVTGLLGRVFSAKTKKKMYTHVSKWGNKNKTQPLMICNDIFQSLGCIYDAAMMDNYELVNFEQTQLMAIKSWDNYLTEQYGDYMTPVRTEH